MYMYMHGMNIDTVRWIEFSLTLLHTTSNTDCSQSSFKTFEFNVTWKKCYRLTKMAYNNATRHHTKHLYRDNGRCHPWITTHKVKLLVQEDRFIEIIIMLYFSVRYHSAGLKGSTWNYLIDQHLHTVTWGIRCKSILAKELNVYNLLFTTTL